MIIISAGMQKAGTGWHFNMTNDLLISVGLQDVRKIRETYRLHPILKYHNCNIGRLMLPKLLLLLIPNLFGNTILVKTHEAPSPTYQLLTAFKVTKSIYIYRDPRDAAVSAFEHGNKLRKQGETHSFTRLHTMEEAILAAKSWSMIWESWTHHSDTLLVQYESMVQDPRFEMLRLIEFLELTPRDETIDEIIESYQTNGANNLKANILHLNKGIVGRYRDILSPSQLDLCRTELGPYLEGMGYKA